MELLKNWGVAKSLKDRLNDVRTCNPKPHEPHTVLNDRFKDVADKLLEGELPGKVKLILVVDALNMIDPLASQYIRLQAIDVLENA
mmetsp:Transcript_2260/g.6012  ORF Transcript_2260/g.6012 Transcript_2260/m.6012 type:complete len:86 (+) Transcript_2260:678-935(+)